MKKKADGLNKKIRGFSLIEVLIVLGIMTMLTSAVFSYGRSSENQIILFKEQAKIINIILRAKNLAIQTYLDEGNICGYGVHIDTTSGKNRLILFKDLSVDSDPCSASDNIYTDEKEIFQIMDLDEKLEFGKIDFTDVLFIPPDPIIIIDNNDTIDIARLNIKVPGLSGSKGISINSTGQVTTYNDK